MRWLYCALVVLCCNLAQADSMESNRQSIDTLNLLKPQDDNPHNLKLLENIENIENIEGADALRKDTHKNISVGIESYSQEGYSQLELRNQRFDKNEIDANLWRAGVGYKASFYFEPSKSIFIHFYFGTSVEILQNRLGGKTKTYNDGIHTQDYAYDWGNMTLQSSNVNNFGLIISIAGVHNIHITIRQIFLDNSEWLTQYAKNLPIIQNPILSAQNQLTGIASRLSNSTQILASYSLYF